MLFIFLSLFSGCVLQSNAGKVKKLLINDYCAITMNIPIESSFDSVDGYYQNYPSLRGIFTTQQAELINTLGLAKEIYELQQLEIAGINSPQKRLEVLIKINQKILLAQNLINGVAEEMDCEVLRATRIRDYLAAIGTKRNNTMTIAAILSGAVAGVAPLAIKNQRSQNIIVISGSALSASFGISVLASNRKKITFVHERNPLGDVWKGPEKANYFPDFIWTMLNEQSPTGSHPISSAAARIKNRWAMLEVSDHDIIQQKLIFGDGGKYTQDNLSIRINLLGQLAAEVRLLNIRLTQLATFTNGRSIK